MEDHEDVVVQVSSEMRRGIIGKATPYRVSDTCTEHKVVGSTTFAEGTGEHEHVELLPLVRMPPEDPRWTELRDTLCFHCCHPFDTPPVWIPQHMDNTGTYHVMPTPFCSLGCAKAHLVELNPFNCSQQLFLLNRVAREVYGHTSTEIVAAPPRQCLRAFGGMLDVAEFRGQTCPHELTLPPFVPIQVYVRRVSTEPSTEDEGRWAVEGLRRPNNPHQLPRAANASTGPSMLERFVDAKRSNTGWCPDDTPRVVTSTMPSVEEVHAARKATCRLGETEGLRGTKPAPPTRKRASKKRSTPANETVASGDLNQFLEPSS
jgi:hypothetical protein